jgi:hypothetical protein
MPYWPTTQGDGQRYQTMSDGFISVTSPGTSVTAGAVGVLGALSAIISTTARSDQLFLHVNNISGSGKMMLNLYLGTSPILQDYMIQVPRINSAGYAIPLPIRISAGQAINAKLRASVAGRTVQLYFTSIQTGFEPWPVGTRLIPYGTIPQGDETGAAFSVDGTILSPISGGKTGWVPLSGRSTTLYEHRGLLVAWGQGGGTLVTNRFLFDIGYGSPETVLIPDILQAHHGTPDGAVNNFWYFPIRVPAGIQLKARSQTDTGIPTFQIAVYGVI